MEGGLLGGVFFLRVPITEGVSAGMLIWDCIEYIV